MTQPLSFESYNKSIVCKLHRELYGLKQTPRVWFDRFKNSLIQLGFAPSKYDQIFFFYSKDTNLAYKMIYVDDILIPSNKKIYHLIYGF